MTTAQILPVDLQAEAAAEVHRLTASRMMAADGDHAALAALEGNAPWMTVVRGANRRRALRHRVLLIWQVAYEDAAGVAVESCLVPIVVDLFATPDTFRRRARIAAIVREADAQIRSQILSATAAWRTSVERVNSAFATARISRERALAARIVEGGDRVFQPGLFDQRADRTRELQAAAVADARRAVAERVATAERRASAAPASPRLLLALLP